MRKRNKSLILIGILGILVIGLSIAYFLIKQNDVNKCTFVFKPTDDKFVFRGYDATNYIPAEVLDAIQKDDWSKIAEIKIKENDKHIIDGPSTTGYYIIDKNQTWVARFNGRSTDWYGPYKGYPCK